MHQNYKCNKKTLILSRKILLIYKSFVTSNPDYADIIYDKHFNESFIRKIKMVQYKAALVITGVIKGTSRDRLQSLTQNFQRIGDGPAVFFIQKIKQGLLQSYLQIYHNAVREGAYLFQQHRIELSQFLQKPKCLRIHFFYIALRNRVNLITKLGSKFKVTLLILLGLKGTRFLI